MKFSADYIIDTHDTNSRGIIRMTPLLRRLQESATRQMTAQPPSNDDLRAAGYAYYLSRIAMSVYAPLYAEDKIEVKTWGVESRGAGQTRCYSVHKGDALIAEATSLWALVRISDKRLMRVDEVPVGFSLDAPLEIAAPTRIRLPSHEMEKVGERKIRYSDIDVNMHMNNTNYADMLCDFIPEMNELFVTGISIAYLNEAPFDEMLSVYMTRDDGKYFFRTLRQDGKTNVEAEIITQNNRG